MKEIRTKMGLALANELQGWGLTEAQIDKIFADFDTYSQEVKDLRDGTTETLLHKVSDNCFFVGASGPQYKRPTLFQRPQRELISALNLRVGDAKYVPGIKIYIEGIINTPLNVKSWPTLDEEKSYKTIGMAFGKHFNLRNALSELAKNSPIDFATISAKFQKEIESRYKSIRDYLFDNTDCSVRGLDKHLVLACKFTKDTPPKNSVETEDAKLLEGLPFGFSKIIKVVEFRKTNERFAIIGHSAHQINYRGERKPLSYFTWMIAKDSDSIYNYLDEGRIVIMQSKNLGYGGSSIYKNGSPGLINNHRGGRGSAEIPKLVFTENDPPIDVATATDNPFHTLMNQGELAGERLILMNNADARKKIAIIAMQVQREVLRKTAETTRVTSFQASFDATTPEKCVTFNNVKYYSDRAEYEGEVLSSNFVSPTKLAKKLVIAMGSKNPDQINFDLITSTFLKEAIEASANKVGKAQKLKIGSVDVTLEFRLAGKSGRYYVNDQRINKAEVEQVLAQALCTQQQAQYDKFCESVSKCSIELHNVINDGLDITINEEGQIWKIKLKIVRKGSRNYLVAGKDEIAIHDTRTLLSAAYSNARDARGNRYYYSTPYNLDWFVKQLEDPAIVGVADHKQLLTIIREGKQLYVDAQKKSEELLNHALTALKLKQTTERIRGNNLNGYVVEGLSGKKYFVDGDDHSSDQYHHKPYGVYTYPEGQAICIVDTASSHMQVGKDALVNRLFALRNDKLVSKQITTLNI